jgi:hypothetical protein
MSDPLWKRLRELDWTETRLSESDVKKHQKLLQHLASRKEARALKAAQELWSLHKTPAPLGRLLKPFLLEIREISTDVVKKEIDELIERIA